MIRSKRVCPRSITFFYYLHNDLLNVSYLFKFILFADDSSLSTLFVEESALEFALTLNHELNNWLTSNRICINADKTKYMIFSYRKLLHLRYIKIGSETIEFYVLWKKFYLNILLILNSWE